MPRVLNREGLQAVIASLTDLAPDATFWSIDPRPYVSDENRAQVLLTLEHVDQLGIDEHRRHVSDGTDGYPAGTFVTQEIGNRDFVVNVRAEVYDRAVEAAELVDQVRTRIRAEFVRDQLNALAIALVDVGQTIMLPTTYDNRVVSVAAADFTFAGIAQWVNTIAPNVGGDYIKEVNDAQNDVPGTFT